MMLWTEARLFRNISNDVREALFGELSQYVRRYQAEAGTAILQAGEIPQYLIIVEQGVLRSVHYTNGGEELSTVHYPPGASIFHIACLTQRPVNSYCMAVQASQYVTIPRDKFVSLLDEFPEFERNLLYYICETSEQLIEHAVTIQMKRPRQRICRYLIEHTDDSTRECKLIFGTELFANYLNLARPTLSRELHQMEAEGLIEIHRRMIRVVSIERLCQELN